MVVSMVEKKMDEGVKVLINIVDDVIIIFLCFR